MTRALSRGTRIDAFEIVDVIAEGACTIVYRANPLAGDTTVAVMEYMPDRLAQRDASGAVAARSPALAPACRQGLSDFVDASRALMRCDHPALVRVLQVIETRGTAWRVMPLVEGRHLTELRADMQEPPGEDMLRDLLDELLGALAAWHREGGPHGDVSAASILVRDDGRPLLLGPASESHGSVAERVAALMTSEEPCFAPVEQIVPTADMPVGPSADLYALAGVLRYCITGELPPPALGLPGTAPREPLRDAVQALRRRWPKLTYGTALIDTLEAALSSRPADRPQNVAQFRAWLATGPPGSLVAEPVADAGTPAAASPAAPRGPRQAWLWGVAAVAALVILSLVFFARPAPEPQRDSARVPEAPVRTDAGVVMSPPPQPLVAPSAPPAPVARPGRVATSPREVCAGRTEFALYRCMKMRCAQAQWKHHAQCERLRRTDRVD